MSHRRPMDRTFLATFARKDGAGPVVRISVKARSRAEATVKLRREAKDRDPMLEIFYGPQGRGVKP